MDGFYMGNIAEGNLLRRFGLQTGDIVEGINDLNFQKPEDIKQLQSLNFSPGQKNVIRVKRQGRSMTLNVD